MEIWNEVTHLFALITGRGRLVDSQIGKCGQPRNKWERWSKKQMPSSN